jgi:beta-glucanase (GH16 family)
MFCPVIWPYVEIFPWYISNTWKIFHVSTLFGEKSEDGVKIFESNCRTIVRAVLPIIALLICFTTRFATAASLFHDDFNESTLSSNSWHIPIWQSPTDGTFIGRTQFRVTQNSSLPSSASGEARIPIELYNPTGFSFYGTDLISNKTFSPEKEVKVNVRARMNASTKGVVGGIFLYTLKPGSTTMHDEIDFELLTNHPNEVQTNIYGNEPFGRGHPQFVAYPHGGTMYDHHDYEIRWTESQVSWYIDGVLVRTDTEYVPSGPMYFHLNIWAPGPEWAEAYNSGLQPVTSIRDNVIHWMNIDRVSISSGEDRGEVFNMIPILNILLQNE